MADTFDWTFRVNRAGRIEKIVVRAGLSRNDALNELGLALGKEGVTRETRIEWARRLCTGKSIRCVVREEVAA